MIKGLENAFVTGKKEVILKSNGKEIKFFAHELGYLTVQNIADQTGKGNKDWIPYLVSEGVTDLEGNKFTYEEAKKLKKEFAEPLFEAVVDLNFGKEEKKS